VTDNDLETFGMCSSVYRLLKKKYGISKDEIVGLIDDHSLITLKFSVLFSSLLMTLPARFSFNMISNYLSDN
jgi:hypothetical protein